jgi:hypothetical protein
MSPNGILPNLILFRIEANGCDLRIGDQVTPETTIGEYLSGEAMKAGCHGRVSGIGFDEDDHALLVVIRPVLS